jgi:predicted transcriptional regulator
MEFSNLKDQITHPGNHISLTLAEIQSILNAKVLCGEDKLSNAVSIACGCDLISDVLAFTNPGSLLLTGLTNSQVVRTAEILDLKGIVFVRDKKPDDQTIAMAKELGIPLLSSPYPLFESCGILFGSGLRGCMDMK